MAVEVTHAKTNGASREPGGDVLERIDRRLERLEALAARLESAAGQAPSAVAAATDTFDHWMEQLGERGVDLDERVKNLLVAFDHLSSTPVVSLLGELLSHAEDVRALLRSGVLEPHALNVVGELGRVLAESGREPPPRVGMLGALRALGEPDVQRALGFLICLARAFGKASASADGIGTSGPKAALPQEASR